MMNLQLETSADTGVPAYQQLVEQLRDRILTGEAPAGAMLPSVRDLGALLEINPLTISKAYKCLEKEGLVRSRQGKGTFVAETEAGRTKEALEDAVRAAVCELATKSLRLGISEELVLELLRIEFRERREKAKGEEEAGEE